MSFAMGCKRLGLLLLIAYSNCMPFDEADEGGQLIADDFLDVGNRQFEPTEDRPEIADGGDWTPSNNIGAEDVIPNKKWPVKNGLVIVPYTIPKNLPAAKKKALANAITEYKDKTIVRLVLRTTEQDYVKIIHTSRNTCSVSSVGKAIGVTNLNWGWCKWGNVVHEFLHILGFFHEHTRPDRNNYVTIDWAAIKEKEKERGQPWAHNFKACTERGCIKSSNHYDFESIMHYPGTTTINNRPRTIISAKPDCPKPPCKLMYQRKYLSKLDIQGINFLYKGKTKEPTCTDKYATACPKYKKYCGQDWMKKLCKKTCNICTPSGPEPFAPAAFGDTANIGPAAFTELDTLEGLGGVASDYPSTGGFLKTGTGGTGGTHNPALECDERGSDESGSNESDEEDKNYCPISHFCADEDSCASGKSCCKPKKNLNEQCEDDNQCKEGLECDDDRCVQDD